MEQVAKHNKSLCPAALFGGLICGIVRLHRRIAALHRGIVSLQYGIVRLHRDVAALH